MKAYNNDARNKDDCTHQHKNHNPLHQEIQVDCQNVHSPKQMDHGLLKHLMKSCN